METKEILAQRLVQLREARGVSQQTLADALEITRQSLSLYEKAERTINAELLAKVARYFSVTSDYLLGLSDAQSVDPDVQTAQKVTGLSDSSVRLLMDDENNKEAVELLLQSPAFAELALWLTSLQFYNKLPLPRVERSILQRLEIENGNYMLDGKTLTNEELKELEHSPTYLAEIRKQKLLDRITIDKYYAELAFRRILERFKANEEEGADHGKHQ